MRGNAGHGDEASNVDIRSEFPGGYVRIADARIKRRRSRGDENTPVDDGLASPQPPPLPARPSPRGRRPSRYPVVRPAGSWPPPPSPSKDDASTTAEDDGTLVAELERKAADVEERLQRKDEENAALKRRIERYHVEWLMCEIKIKSLEEACHEQMAALQAAQDAKAARADESVPCDRRETLESLMKASEEPSARPRRGVGARRSGAASNARLGSEFRRQSQALDHGAAAFGVVDPWQPVAPSSNAVDDELRKLKARFSAWKKDYKARLHRARAEVDRERRRTGGCWI